MELDKLKWNLFLFDLNSVFWEKETVFVCGATEVWIDLYIILQTLQPLPSHVKHVNVAAEKQEKLAKKKLQNPSLTPK